MLVNEKTYEAIIELLTLTFQGNSHADNCAYWLGFHDFLGAEKIFHERYAHAFPQWADEITTFLDKFDARATRGALEKNDTNYQDIRELFTDVERFLTEYKNKVKEVIEVAEVYDDLDVKVFLEEYSLRLTKYIKQVNIWKRKASLLVNDVIRFDDEFEDFTII